MEFILTLLTNGRQDCLEKTLAAFERYVTPRPSKLFIHIDGPHPDPRPLYGDMEWEVSRAPDPVGFTFGTDDCYAAARDSQMPWLFHL